MDHAALRQPGARQRRRLRRIPIVAALSVFAALLLWPSTPAAAAFSGPITITRGGTYSGQWESLDPNVPAVKVATREPVTIVDSHVRSRGDLILGSSVVNLTVRNTVGEGLHPGRAGRQAGQFIATDGGFTNLVVENNTFSRSAGIWAYNYSGNRTASQTVKVLRNRAVNLDARTSTSTGWLTDEDSQEATQFVQLDNVRDVPHIEIAWNHVSNEPGDSRVEDNVNFFRSGGTQASPARIHHNLVDGGYPAIPTQDQGYAGGGIIVGDAPSASQSGRWVHIHDNTVLATTNYGISIVCGTDQRAWNNRVVASGVLPDGRRITNMNVGLSVGHAGSWGGPCTSSAYQRNGMDNNVVGWQRTATSRNDWWTPHCAAGACTGNVSLSGTITRSVEQAERDRWQSMRAAAGVQVGAGGASTTTTTAAPTTTTAAPTTTTAAPTTTTTAAPTTTTTVAPTTTTTAPRDGCAPGWREVDRYRRNGRDFVVCTR